MIRIASVALPKSPMNLAQGDEVPQIITRRTRQRPREFLTPLQNDFCNTILSRADMGRLAQACTLSAKGGSRRSYSITLSPRSITWLRWSFGQPGLPQSFFQSREVFPPIRAQHLFETGNP